MDQSAMRKSNNQNVTKPSADRYRTRGENRASGRAGQRTSGQRVTGAGSAEHRVAGQNLSVGVNARRPANLTGDSRQENQMARQTRQPVGRTNTRYGNNGSVRQLSNKQKALIRRKKRIRRRIKRLIFITLFCTIGILVFFTAQNTVKFFLDKSNSIFDNETDLNEESGAANAVNAPAMKAKYSGRFAADLSAMAETEPKINTIINNAEKYPEKVLELLVKNPETLDFVLGYPDRKKSKAAIDISDSYKKGTIPLFIQWDKQWGYENYGDNIIALNGCGPTCLSMVAVGLTGDTTMNPKKVCDYSFRNGYLDGSNGSSWSLMSEGSKGLGLKAKEIPLDANRITRELDEGKPVVVNVGKGDFTTTGHFIVLTGIAKNGKVLLNDPNSRVRSDQEWDLQVIMKQARNFWSFTKA